MKIMKYPYALVYLLFLVSISCANPIAAQTINSEPEDYNQLSETFLVRAIANQDTKDIQDVLANTNSNDLENALDNDAKRLAFWINVYNAYIQVILKEQPELYDDRGTFFKKDQITIAGERISFAKIEHGLLRKSQWEYGLGYIRKWFPNAFERKFRLAKRDYRVHFALNCGALDCPPVAVYAWERLEEQLEKGTSAYLKNTSTYDKEQNEVAVTALFSWFRGDFGGKSGVKNILKENGVLPSIKDIELRYKSYDWTLKLDNYIEL